MKRYSYMENGYNIETACGKVLKEKFSVYDLFMNFRDY